MRTRIRESRSAASGSSSSATASTTGSSAWLPSSSTSPPFFSREASISLPMKSFRRWQLFALSSRKRRCSSVDGPASPAQQQAAVAADHRHRRAQLVAHDREQLLAPVALRAQLLAQRGRPRGSRGGAPGWRAAARSSSARSCVTSSNHQASLPGASVAPGEPADHAPLGAVGRRSAHSTGRVRARPGAPGRRRRRARRSGFRRARRPCVRAGELGAAPGSPSGRGRRARTATPDRQGRRELREALLGDRCVGVFALRGLAHRPPLRGPARPQPGTRRSRRSARTPVPHRRFRAPALTAIPFWGRLLG